MLASCALALAFGGCHFDSQPLFEPAAMGDGGSRSSGRAQTGEGQLSDLDAGSQGDATSGDAADGGMWSDAGSSTTCPASSVLGCEHDQLVSCAADGSARERHDCGALGCNAEAKRCNECRPDSISCSDGTLLHCGPDGRVAQQMSCAMGCTTPASAEPVCRACSDGDAACRDGDLLRCAPDGLSFQTSRCPSGCDESAPQCLGTLVPTNIPQDACSWTDLTAVERRFEGEATLDTDRDCPRVIRQGAELPDLCVLVFERLSVAAGANLQITGSRGLVLLATHSIEVQGRISVSARAAERGPGSRETGDGAGSDAVGRVAEGTQVGMWTNLPANAGGGGAGHATPGASGGGAPGQCGPALRCLDPGAGGEAYGTQELVPLIGGSGGGQNSAAEWSTRRRRGGGGGGALQLVACDELSLGPAAILDANGGGGEGGGPGSSEMDSETPGAGAGGGSGGAILLQAVKLNVQAGALLVANGGGGGGGATRTADGAEAKQAGEPGQDGRLGLAPAAGGVGAGKSLSGGAGGAKDPPIDGERAKQKTQAAGGGGGAAGRIRLESAVGATSAASLLSSPPATYGTVLME